MWNAFGNGSSGYVSKAQGWEFVPCSRLERPGKKLQSPARVRSFPSNLPELPPGPPPAAAASDATHPELQSPHTRTKKKLEELKKRFDQEKEEWRVEKETLLRQVADIQGGENRRILLDLKCVLEEVQSGVKREESKRGELELQYMKDRCAWDLERSELKSRITQLEARGCSVVAETVRSPEVGDTLKRERAEQKKLLADTHSAAMDLRCRLENSEKGWVKEKSELLERFEAERKEWENQLMDMQRRIEEALKEIARVSEELCSYQEETRKWPDIKRSRSESTFFPREADLVERVKNNLEMEDTILYLKNMSEDLKSLDEQYWTNWEGCNMESQQSEAKPQYNMRQQAPPIPARSTSWYLSSPCVSEIESTCAEQGCQWPGTHPDRKYTSPAIVRKFEAMLQENEGKILTDSGNVACSVPVDSKSNISCCQSRWSCDGSRFGSNQLSRYLPVKRCLSNVDIAAAASDRSLNQIDEHNQGAYPPLNMPSDSAASLDFISPYPSTAAISRNERLEQKTAEFNRTLFQAGMGVRCDEDISMKVSADSSHSLPEAVSKDTFIDSPSRHVEDNPKDVLSDLVAQCSNEEGRRKETKSLFTNSSSLQQEVLSLKQDSEVKSSPVKQLVPSVGEKLSASPPHLQTQLERSSKDLEVGTDQQQVDKKAKQTKKDMCCTRSRILEENPWKPSTLAAYPRPMESRSNYGAVERILKNYEDLERSQEQHQRSQPSPGKKEDLVDLLEMLDMQHEPSMRLTHTPHQQVIAHKETHVSVQQCKESSLAIKKSFSRPARPAKRRLPSRWASRPSASAPSPPPTGFTQRQTLTYSTFHTETVI
ncbi:protein SOGA3a isoform X3 [Puntigrus tetrazona]|uniref:protein SOGA3a isoform X3 n=1 Tax=Puntigrus tetrazona TaxID=1606681 RepID=UPI001C88EDE8|nr:protein SOGA3a isoform X3 [Puntigrus tetrazona]